MGKLFSDESKALFPISKIDTLVTLFQNEFILTGDNKSKVEGAGLRGEPNLTLASIILGAVEHSLTGTPSAFANSTAAAGAIAKERKEKDPLIHSPLKLSRFTLSISEMLTFSHKYECTDVQTCSDSRSL